VCCVLKAYQLGIGMHLNKPGRRDYPEWPALPSAFAVTYATTYGANSLLSKVGQKLSHHYGPSHA